MLSERAKQERIERLAEGVAEILREHGVGPGEAARLASERHPLIRSLLAARFPLDAILEHAAGDAL